MSTTAEITGFFSKEHRALIFLICLSLYGLFKVYTQQQEMLSEIKLINYRLNGETKADRKEKLASCDFYRRKRKPQFQAANYPVFGSLYRRWCGVQNSDRIRSTVGNIGMCFYWLCSFGTVYQYHTESFLNQ